MWEIRFDRVLLTSIDLAQMTPHSNCRRKLASCLCSRVSLSCDWRHMIRFNDMKPSRRAIHRDSNVSNKKNLVIHMVDVNLVSGAGHDDDRWGLRWFCAKEKNRRGFVAKQHQQERRHAFPPLEWIESSKSRKKKNESRTTISPPPHAPSWCWNAARRSIRSRN